MVSDAKIRAYLELLTNGFRFMGLIFILNLWVLPLYSVFPIDEVFLLCSVVFYVALELKVTAKLEEEVQVVIEKLGI